MLIKTLPGLNFVVAIVVIDDDGLVDGGECVFVEYLSIFIEYCILFVECVLFDSANEISLSFGTVAANLHEDSLGCAG